jgi:hypothetical protein
VQAPGPSHPRRRFPRQSRRRTRSDPLSLARSGRSAPSHAREQYLERTAPRRWSRPSGASRSAHPTPSLPLQAPPLRPPAAPPARPAPIPPPTAPPIAPPVAPAAAVASFSSCVQLRRFRLRHGVVAFLRHPPDASEAEWNHSAASSRSRLPVVIRREQVIHRKAPVRPPAI